MPLDHSRLTPAMLRVFSEYNGKHGEVAPGILRSNEGDFEINEREFIDSDQAATLREWADDLILESECGILEEGLDAKEAE